MLPILLSLSLLSSAASAADKPKKGGLFDRVSAFLNGPVKRSPRVAAVAAVRGGIPTEMGENLDDRLLNRVRPLRDAMKRPDPSAGEERSLRSTYEALAASQYVQALSIPGGGPARAEAAQSLEKWASEPRNPPLPGELKSLLSGPSSRIDDKSLVSAGWGKYVRGLSPDGAKLRPAQPGWSAGEEVRKLDETLKSVLDSTVERTLDDESKAKAHALAGDLYRMLAASPLKGVPDAPAASVAAAVPLADAPADPPPAPAADIPFEPKAIYQNVAKSVVLILCSAGEGSGELGTGSVVDAQRRRILTNAHVVIRDSNRQPWPMVKVYFKPARLTGDTKTDLADPVDAKVIAWDNGLDLALIEVPSLPAGVGAVPLGDPRSIEVGDRVAAIGHPEQGGLWTLTTGVISTFVKNMGGVKGKDAFQTDASINRGNSGGPLLDASGRIVGVNTLMSRKAADGLAITAVNFAVRSDVARNWMAAAGGTQTAYAPAKALSVPAGLGIGLTIASAPAPEMQAPPMEKPAAAKPAPKAEPRMAVTEAAKPYKYVPKDVIEEEMAELEDMGEEMSAEIKRRAAAAQPPQK